MPQILRTGVVNTSNFYESDAMNTYGNPDASSAYTPANAQNSCITGFTWAVPAEAVAGTLYRIQITVEYRDFDTSSTAGTFSMWWQGSVYNKTESAWQWAGNNPITSALTNAKGLTALVLSSTKGCYTYDTTMSLPQNNVNTYTQMHVGIRSDYSNGTGYIRISNFKVILDKYSVSDKTKMRVGSNYATADEFIEN